MTRSILAILLASAVACGNDDNRGPGDTSRAGDPWTGGDPASGDPTGGSGDPAAPNEVDWAILQFPTSSTGQAGAALDVFGRVFEAGVTEGVGQGTGIDGAVGVGAVGAPVATWDMTVAQFNVDADNNDEYVATITLSATPGTYRYGIRFRVDGGPWVWADLDGSDNGFDLAQAGTLVVEAPPAPAVDYCELSAPTTLLSGPGETSATITAKVYEPGITDTGDPSGIVAQVGHGAAGGDPFGWTWTDATFQSHIVNDDEYGATLVAPADAGVFDYGFRFRLATASDWLVCDLDGSANGFTSAQAGKLTVAVSEVDWARTILPAETVSVIPGQAVGAQARAYEPGVTDGIGDGGVTVEVGIGDDGTDPNTHGSWVFFPAVYAGDLDSEGGSTNADDLFGGQVAAPSAAGTYDLAVRLRLASEPWLFADGSGSTRLDPYDPAESRPITVVDLPPNGLVTWCAIQWPVDPILVTASVRVGSAFGRVRAVAGASPSETTGTDGTGPTPRSQLGVGTRDTDPSSDGSWTWVGGTFNVFDAEFNDEHTAVLVAPPTAGDYDWVWRFSMDDGATWTYCDRDGSANGFASAQAGKLTVQ